jgi:hypothetical protein
MKKKFTTSPLSIALLLSLLFCSTAKSQTGNALSFTGGRIYAFNGTTDNTYIMGGQSTTVEFWAKAAPNFSFPLDFSYDYQVVTWGTTFGWAVNGGDQYGTGFAVEDCWHHYALTYNGATGTIYGFVDGQPAPNPSYTGTFPPCPVSLIMGGRINDYAWVGAMDEVRVWNVQRTQTQLQANMYTSLAGTETGLLMYYKFNQGAASGDNTAITSLTGAGSLGVDGTFVSFSLNGSSSNFVTSGAMLYYPEIDIKGNSTLIASGSNTPSTTDGTDFGTLGAGGNLVRTFTISNTGSKVLDISSLASNNSLFVVSTLTPTSPIPIGQSATFNVTFTPTAANTATATIAIVNDDCDEGTYTFGVTGIGTNTYTFNGTTSTNWATASNWSSGVVPTSLSSGDAVVIAANCVMNDVTISFPSGTSLTVNSGITLSPSLNTYITIASGATLTLNASASMSTGRITNSGTMDIYGTYNAFYMTNNSGGVMNVKSGGSYSCPACAEDMKAGSTVNNNGTLHLGTASTWQCTVNNNNGGTITDGGNGAQVQLGSSSIVTNAGSFVSRTAGTAGSFINSGTLSTPGTCNFTIKTGAVMTNSGSMTFSSSDNNLNIQSSASLTNTGTVTNNGTMSVNASATFTNNGTYKGSGTFTGSLFTNPSGGIINVGNSAGCMTFSNGFTNSGTIQIEVNGVTDNCTQFDKINVTGTATLGGTLAFTFSYGGSGNDKASYISATTVSGTFATVTGMGLNWFNNYEATKATISFGAVLSAELTQFKGQNTEGGNLLTWTTANEENMAQFDIERSTDGQTFNKIGSTKATGSNSTYEFTDKDPLSNLTFYRLKMIETNGKTAFSKIISIQTKGSSKLSVYPTLVSNGFINLNGENTEGGYFFIYNLLGQPVLTGKTTTQIDVSALAAGTYVFKIGNEQARFVKQ